MKKALFFSLCALLLAGTGCKKNAEPEPHKVIVTSVSVKPSSLSLKVGETAQLTATVTPVNADNDNVNWSSSDNSVATVADGLVTAVKEGSATITVTTIDGGKTATCAVTVSTDIVPVTGIAIDQGATAEVEEGNTITLTATVQPENATDKTVTWSSSNDAIATVANGTVTGVTPGEVVITAKAGDRSATCSVVVHTVLPDGAVDLGIVMTREDGTSYKLYWAASNLCEDGLCAKPEEYGDYYAWGETAPYYSSQDPLNWKYGKTGYNWASYSLCDGSETTLTKYNTSISCGTVDNETVLKTGPNGDDVASKKLGGRWRMPTDAEWTALRNSNNCAWTWTAQNGVNGYLVTSKKNGNSIFLPAAGARYDTYLSGASTDGYYWSSSLSTDYPFDAWYVNFYWREVYRERYYRYYGFSVRPVSE